MKFRHILRVILLAAALGFAAFTAIPASAATGDTWLVKHNGVVFDDETMTDSSSTDEPAAADPAEPSDPPAEPEGN